MERDRYCYCNVCANKTYNQKQLLICKKTGNIPVFGLKCDNYSLDEAEFKNVEDKLLWAIEKNFDRGDFMVEINRKTELFKHEKCQDYMKLPENMVFRKVSYTFLWIVVLVFAFSIPDFVVYKIPIGFILLMVPIIIIAVWAQKQGDVTQIGTLVLSKEGIDFNGNEYAWDDIMTTHIQYYFYKRFKTRSSGKFLILGLKSGKIVKTINIHGIRLSSRWWKLLSYPMSAILGHYVELYRNGHQNKWAYS